MTSSDMEYNQSREESEYFQPQKSLPNSKRARVPSDSDSSQDELILQSDSSNKDVMPRKLKQRLKLKQDNGEEEEVEEIEEDAPQSEFPDGGVFFPDIEIILWKRTQKTNLEFEYLVKYKEYSYLQCEWISEKEVIAGGKNGKQKINRFNKNFDKKLKDLEVHPDDPQALQHYFDQSFVEVDRILQSAEMFPVIHPKKAHELKDKWTELLTIVVSKLLSFTKDKVKYGVFFMEPVNPDTDGCQDYRKFITQPMDLGTALNRLYLDYYSSCNNFWYELGLVFRNCRHYNKDEESEIRILCDTLREAAIILYKQWHIHQGKRYNYLLQLLQIHQNQPNEQLKNELQQQYVSEITERHRLKQQNLMAQKVLEFLKEENVDVGNSLEQQIMMDKRTLAEYLKHFDLGIEEEGNLFQVTLDLYTHQEHVSLSCGEFIKIIREHYGDKGLPLVQDDDYLTTIVQQATTLADEQILRDMEKFQNILESTSELELRNPGTFTLEWLQDDNKEQQEELCDNVFVQHGDPQLDLMTPVDTLYLIKWKNVSYQAATWEPLSSLNISASKLNEFRSFNRALDRDSRNQMIHDCQQHKIIYDWENNPKKRARISNSQVGELKTTLYQLNISTLKTPLRYTARTQPIYKERRLLRDYQLDSLNWMIDAYYDNRNILLADEMGLGKTIQSIAFLNHLFYLENCRGPFLVVAPLSTLTHWKRTVEEWTTLNAVLYYDSAGVEGRAACALYEQFYTDISTKGSVLTNRELYKFQVLITSYEVFNQDISLILPIPFKFVVVDEAHRLKNQQAKILQTLRRLPCKRVMLLTGTPIQNNTVYRTFIFIATQDELWSLLNFIEPVHFANLNDFKCDFGELVSAEQIEKLNLVLKPYILRRQKEDVESSIPPLQENIIDIEMTTLQKTIYRALYERNKTYLLKGFSQYTAQAATLNNLEMQLRKCCNHPMLIRELFNEMAGKCLTDVEYTKLLIESSGKMILLDKMLTKFINQKKKILIFSQFTQMLALLEDYLSAKSIKYEKITGEVKSTERQNAIDRFNDVGRGRMVFLLSTKAGGQGINLTAAEVVIIYDSDWNPQNDVQATARAHRIGQEKEVAVYRFITKNTYESEMFERATKKLGLDQAIFMGGEFKQAQFADNDEQKIYTSKKLCKADMELLLKKGSLGLLEQQMQEDQDKIMLEQDIDDVLNNTRIAKYSLIKGSYTISKQSYVADKDGQDLDVNDPNFWQKVLKNQESKSKILLNRLEQDYKSLTQSLQTQREFLLDVAECINALVQSKLSQQGFNADDENNITDVLNQVAFKTEFHANYRNIATNWIYEVNKPSRRYKKITEQDLDINPLKVIQPPIPENVQAVPSPIKFKWSEGEEAKKLELKSKSDLLTRLCANCERPKCTFFCIGFCRQSFHDQCRDGPKGQRTQKPKELDWDSEKLQKTMDIKYLCQNCEKLEGECFLCGKNAPYNLQQEKEKQSQKNEEVVTTTTFDQIKSIMSESKRTRTRANTKKDVETVNVFNQAPKTELVKCSVYNCPKLYHYACVQTNKHFRILDGQTQRFKCPLHYCCKCTLKPEEHQGVLQCLRCTRAFHQKCLTKDIHKYNKKFVLCNNHKAVKTTNQDALKPERENSPQPQIRKKQKHSSDQKEDKGTKTKKDEKRKQKHKELNNKAQREVLSPGKQIILK